MHRSKKNIMGPRTYIVTITFLSFILSEYLIVPIPCIRRYLRQLGHGAELLNTLSPAVFILFEFRTTINVAFASFFLPRCVATCVNLYIF